MTKYNDDLCIECKQRAIYAKGLCNKCYQRHWNNKRTGTCNLCGIPNRRLYANGTCESCIRKKRNYTRKVRACKTYEEKIYCPVCGGSPSECRHTVASKYRYCDICGEKFRRPQVEANHYSCWRQWCIDGRGGQRETEDNIPAHSEVCGG